MLSVVLSFSLTAALATGGAVAQTSVPVIPFESPKPAGPPAGIVAPGAAATPAGGPPLRPAVIIEGDPKDKAATPKPVAKVVASKPGPVKGKGAAGIKHAKPAPSLPTGSPGSAASTGTGTRFIGRPTTSAIYA